jgi:hypothetical protein
MGKVRKPNDSEWREVTSCLVLGEYYCCGEAARTATLVEERTCVHRLLRRGVRKRDMLVKFEGLTAVSMKNAVSWDIFVLHNRAQSVNAM